jgi:predicted RNA binding protein YcfA (HicA-like mRNA interferase family)
MDLYEKINRNPHNVTPKELIELLEVYGFEYRKTVGDHAQYKRPGYRPFPVPIRQSPLDIRIVKLAIRVIREIREIEQD